MCLDDPLYVSRLSKQSCVFLHHPPPCQNQLLPIKDLVGKINADIAYFKSLYFIFEYESAVSLS